MITICTHCGKFASDVLAHECAGICPVCGGILKDPDAITAEEEAHLTHADHMETMR